MNTPKPIIVAANTSGRLPAPTTPVVGKISGGSEISIKNMLKNPLTTKTQSISGIFTAS